MNDKALFPHLLNTIALLLVHMANFTFVGLAINSRLQIDLCLAIDELQVTDRLLRKFGDSNRLAAGS